MNFLKKSIAILSVCLFTNSTFANNSVLNVVTEPSFAPFEFMDQSQAKHIVAQGIAEAYEDLFNLRKDAQNLSNDEVKNKLKTLTQGQKGDRVIEQMASTFKALCNYADWTQETVSTETVTTSTPHDNPSAPSNITSTPQGATKSSMNLHYNIQIHLPETTNMAVYDAIFQSLKKHLM